MNELKITTAELQNNFKALSSGINAIKFSELGIPVEARDFDAIYKISKTSGDRPVLIKMVSCIDFYEGAGTTSAERFAWRALWREREKFTELGFEIAIKKDRLSIDGQTLSKDEIQRMLCFSPNAGRDNATKRFADARNMVRSSSKSKSASERKGRQLTPSRSSSSDSSLDSFDKSDICGKNAGASQVKSIVALNSSIIYSPRIFSGRSTGLLTF